MFSSSTVKNIGYFTLSGCYLEGMLYCNKSKILIFNLRINTQILLFPAPLGAYLNDMFCVCVCMFCGDEQTLLFTQFYSLSLS